MAYTITRIASNTLSPQPIVFNGTPQTGAGHQIRQVIYPTGSPDLETIPALLCLDWYSGLELNIAWETGDPGWAPGTQLLGTSTRAIPGTNVQVKFALTSPISWQGAGTNWVTLDATASLVGISGSFHSFLCPPIAWQIKLNDGTIISLGTRELEIYFCPEAELATLYPSTIVTVQQARFLVAKDLAKPFLTTSSPTALQSAAASTQGAFLSPPAYSGIPHYQSNGFELTDWLFALSGLNPSPIGNDCSDSANMCSLVTQLQQNPAVQQVWVGSIMGQGYMYLKPTVFRGGGMPFYDFGWHDIVLYSSSGATGACDATIGPHLGNETPDKYVQDTFSNTANVPSPFQTGGFAWGDPPSQTNYLRSFRWPAKVDGLPFSLPLSLTATPSSAVTALSAASETAHQAFASRINFVPPATGGAPVSVSGFDPAVACPSLAKLGLKFRRTSDSPVWRRYFVYADNNVQAHLKIWELTDSAHARGLFLDEGAAGEGRLPYAPDLKVGDASGFRKVGTSQDCIWLYRNVVIRLTVIGDQIDAKDTAQYLQRAMPKS